MKKLIIVLTLLYSVISFAENPLKGMIERLIAMKPKLTQDAYYQKLQWNDGLAEYLVESKDADISILGYRFILPNYLSLVSISKFEDNHSIKDVVNDINNMVENNQLSPYGLSIALSVCHKFIENISGVSCNYDLIFQKQKELTPKNAFNYIYPIHRVAEEKDEKHLKVLLEQMAQSTYIELYNYTPVNFEGVIDEYYLLNPFGEDYLNHEKDSFIKGEGLSDETKERVLNGFEEYGLLMEKINFEQLIEFPPLRVVTDMCKSETKYNASCLKISNILIKSKDIVAKLVGHSIKTNILKRSGNKTAYTLSEKAHNILRKQYECLGKINKSINGFEFLDYDSYKIFSSTQREKGSWDFFIKQTQYFYDKAIQNGNTELRNPDDCFK